MENLAVRKSADALASSFFSITQKEAVVFQCSQCGECCSSMNIRIEREKATALSEKPWVQQRFQETGLNFIPFDETDLILPLTEAGYCVFLDENKRCMIHAREGLALKPSECIRFPFAAVNAPDGTRVYDASSSCKTVTETLLKEFSPIVPSFGHDVCPQDTTFPSKLRVRWGQSLPWPAYERYEQGLKTIVQKGTPDPNQTLRYVFRFIRTLCQSGTIDTLPLLRSGNSGWTSFRHRWLWTTALRRPYGMLNQWAVWTEGAYTDPKIFGLDPILLKGHSRIRWPEGAELEACHTAMNGFLYQILTRKVMLAQGYSLMSQLAVAVYAEALVRWYAQTLALIQGEFQVSLSDVYGAIRLVERYYTGHQPVFIAPFRFFPVYEWSLWLWLS